MAIVYGEIEPLEKIINLLRHIDEAKHLNTLDDVLAFKKTCDQKVYEVESRVRREQGLIIEQQRSMISDLEDQYHTKLNEKREALALKSHPLIDRLGSFKVDKQEGTTKIGGFFKRIRIGLRLRFMNFVGEKYIFWSLRKPARRIKQELGRLENQESSFQNIVEEKVRKEVKPFYEAKRIIEFNNSHLIGAIGEQRVLDELVDFTPIDQLKRTNFALFCYLNQKKNRGFFSLFFRKRENKKVTIRSILVMVNAMTDEKDQFVKVLSVDRLIGYIKYFSMLYDEEEKEVILNNLLF